MSSSIILALAMSASIWGNPQTIVDKLANSTGAAASYNDRFGIAPPPEFDHPL